MSRASISASAFLRNICTILALAVPVLSWAAEGGKFQFVTGDVQVLSADGKHRVPVKGDSFSTGDTIVTGASGTAQIRMNDGGLMAVRANTQLKLDQYIFNGREDGNERSLISLIKGGFRTITGLIGNRNKENYRILTPSATIGIRGTDHEPFVVPAGATGGFQEGTYDRVYRGATIITTDKGKLIVNPNQVGFTPGKGAAPVILPKIPEFYDVKPQLPNASKDGDKGQQDAGDATTTTTTKSDAIKSLSTTNSLKSVREVDTDTTPTTTLKSNLSTTNLKALSTDTLTTPLVDTTRATTTIDTSTIKSDVLTVPTTTLKSTTSLTTTPATNAVTTPVTTVTTPITTTIVAPVTTTIVAPVTTTITTPVTTITTPVTKSLDTTLSVPTTTIQKITR